MFTLANSFYFITNSLWEYYFVHAIFSVSVSIYNVCIFIYEYMIREENKGEYWPTWLDWFQWCLSSALSGINNIGRFGSGGSFHPKLISSFKFLYRCYCCWCFLNVYVYGVFEIYKYIFFNIGDDDFFCGSLKIVCLKECYVWLYLLRFKI